MPIPWDTFVPFAIICGVSLVVGETMVYTHRYFREGKVLFFVLDVTVVTREATTQTNR